jgi:hypothetical protein
MIFARSVGAGSFETCNLHIDMREVLGSGAGGGAPRDELFVMIYGQKVLLSGFSLGSVQVRLFAKKAVFIGKSRFVLKLAFGASLSLARQTGVPMHSGLRSRRPSKFVVLFSFQPRMTGAVTRVDENCSRKE